MGTIVDLTNLLTRLIESVQDRKFAADLREIQGMIGSFQSEQATLHERNLALMSENAQLKQKIATLEQRIAHIQQTGLQQISNEKKRLGDSSEKILKYFFDVARPLSVEEVAAQFKLEVSVVSYHFDQLLDRDFILQHSFAQAVSELIAVRGGSDRDRPATYIIVPEGRQYVVEVIGA